MATNVVSSVNEHTHRLAKSNNAFAIHLYETLRDANQSENLFFSPLSISTAMAMTHLGAKGTSSSQIAEVLRFNRLEEWRLHHSFKELNSLLFGSDNKYVLRAANKLYGKAGYDLAQDFLDGTRQFYDSVFESVADFTDPSAIENINDWVSQQTEGRIQDLIAPGALDALTRLILVNAVYFKGQWATQFDPEDTEPGVFKMKHDETAMVNMMQLKGKFQLSDDKVRKCFVLELPYDGKDLSMLAVLPWEDDGLASVESQLTEDVLDFWDSDLEEEKVNIQFPRFKLEDQFSLSTSLASMGMSDPFVRGKANFEGISGDKSLFISEVLHKAFVEFNEEGTEAAAATAVRIATRSLGSRPFWLNFDHPFMFLIRDRRTEAVLFMGRVVDPPHSSRVSRDELWL